MGYHAAIAPELAAMFGKEGNPTPHVTCDGCGARLEVLTRSGMPAQWFLRRRNAPGWKMQWPEDGTMRAWCARCTPPADDTKPAAPPVRPT